MLGSGAVGLQEPLSAGDIAELSAHRSGWGVGRGLGVSCLSPCQADARSKCQSKEKKEKERK